MDRIDKLNRGEYIKFVENLIIKSEDYKRDDESSSYVIALDSPWGTGKSFFIDLLVQDIKSNEKIRVVKYNAWKNDYSDDAFNPLIYDILNSDCLHLSVTNEADKEIARNIINNIVNVGIVFGKQWIKDAVKEKTGFDVDKIIEEAFKSGKDIKHYLFEEIPNLAELNAQREAFEKFKSYLSNITEKMAEDGEKLVVVIDELDRCKPTFAIQTLEVVKHIFDIKNTVFLFAVDLRQLSYSISSVYGQGFDSVGYLRRFFDYIAKLPAPSIKEYIDEKILSLESIPAITSMVSAPKYTTKNINAMISDFFLEIYNVLNFSLRDLDTIIQTYKIMLDNFLTKYEMAGAHMIYIFYISLKYKRPDIFYKVFVESSTNKSAVIQELSDIAPEISAKNKWINSTLPLLYENKPLQEVSFYIECDETGTSQIYRRCTIVCVEGDYIVAKYKGNESLYAQQHRYYNLTTLSVGNVLFSEDLNKWEQIKGMTYKDYLHRQLEMYNFSVID